MAIHFTCDNPTCGQPVKAPDTAAGKKARCPHCQSIQVVPAASTMFPELSSDLSQIPPARPEQPSATMRPAVRMMHATPPEPTRSVNRRLLVVAGLGLLAVLGVFFAVYYVMSTQNVSKPSEPPGLANLPRPSAVDESPSGSVAIAPTAVPAIQLPVTPAVTTPLPTPAAVQPTVTPTPVPTPRPLPAPTPLSVVPQLAYVQVVLEARKLAQFTTSETNLRTVWKSVQIYEAANGQLPNNLTDIELDGLRSPGDKTKTYVYIPGQKLSTTGKNILAYDPFLYRGAAVAVLRVDGTIDGIHVDDLKAALKAQGAKPVGLP